MVANRWCFFMLLSYWSKGSFRTCGKDSWKQKLRKGSVFWRQVAWHILSYLLPKQSRLRRIALGKKNAASQSNSKEVEDVDTTETCWTDFACGNLFYKETMQQQTCFCLKEYAKKLQIDSSSIWFPRKCSQVATPTNWRKSCRRWAWTSQWPQLFRATPRRSYITWKSKSQEHPPQKETTGCDSEFLFL